MQVAHGSIGRDGHVGDHREHQIRGCKKPSLSVRQVVENGFVTIARGVRYPIAKTINASLKMPSVVDLQGYRPDIDSNLGTEALKTYALYSIASLASPVRPLFVAAIAAVKYSIGSDLVTKLASAASSNVFFPATSNSNMCIKALNRVEIVVKNSFSFIAHVMEFPLVQRVFVLIKEFDNDVIQGNTRSIISELLKGYALWIFPAMVFPVGSLFIAAARVFVVAYSLPEITKSLLPVVRPLLDRRGNRMSRFLLRGVRGLNNLNTRIIKLDTSARSAGNVSGREVEEDEFDDVEQGGASLYQKIASCMSRFFCCKKGDGSVPPAFNADYQNNNCDKREGMADGDNDNAQGGSVTTTCVDQEGAEVYEVVEEMSTEEGQDGISNTGQYDDEDSGEYYNEGGENTSRGPHNNMFELNKLRSAKEGQNFDGSVGSAQFDGSSPYIRHASAE